MAINSIGTINSLIPTKSIFEPQSTEKSNASIPFSEYFKQAMDTTNSLLMESDRITADFAAGITDNIHAVTIASEKADTALQFTLQIRNKIMDAYAEIMRMQI